MATAWTNVHKWCVRHADTDVTDFTDLQHYLQEDTTHPNNNSPLHFSVIGKSSVVTRYLLNHTNININIINRLKETPLHWASFQGLPETVQILLSHGADPSLADKGKYA